MDERRRTSGEQPNGPLPSRADWLRTPHSARRIPFVVLVGVVLAAVLVVSFLFLKNPFALTVTEVRRTVVTTIQAEAPASFFVTGTLDVTATSTVENTRYLFPELLRFDLGTTRATVRLPGRVAYGFDVRRLRPEDILVGVDGVVEVTLPTLSVFSVEPHLDAMEVETAVGWARTHAGSGQQVTQRALQFAQQALREQGTSYLESATQPRVHTAEALQHLLTPALEAAGLSNPRFRFHLGEHLVLQPE